MTAKPEGPEPQWDNTLTMEQAIEASVVEIWTRYGDSDVMPKKDFEADKAIITRNLAYIPATPAPSQPCNKCRGTGQFELERNEFGTHVARCGYCGGTGQTAPSQPAGAREQVMEALDWWQRANSIRPVIVWNALCAARDAISELAQQNAAKDAICERIQKQRDELVTENRALRVAKEAAERERDSLRDALERIAELPHYEASKIADAALKAGKDGQQ